MDFVAHRGKQYQFSAWLASRPFDDPDYAILQLEIFDQSDAVGTLLGAVEFHGNDANSPFVVGSLNLEGFADPAIPATQDNWTLYRATGVVPLSAHSAAVTTRSALDIYGYVDLVSLQVEGNTSGLVGDFNGNDEVEQGDLDLVLLNWGSESIVAPEGWIRNLPTGAIDQAELDAVLLNWGNTQPPMNGVGAVPEPATVSLVLGLLPVMGAVRRAHQRRTTAVSEQ